MKVKKWVEEEEKLNSGYIQSINQFNQNRR